MAASNAAAKAVRQPTAPAKPGRKGFWIFVCLIMPVALMLLPSTLVLLAAMVPTLVARVVDPVPGRHLTITVGSLNFAGALWFMHDLWSAGQSFAAIAPTLTDMIGWLAALVGAGLGWAIYSLMPIVSRGIAAAKSDLRLKRVRNAQEDLVEEWGPPVRGHLLAATPPAQTQSKP